MLLAGTLITTVGVRTRPFGIWLLLLLLSPAPGARGASRLVLVAQLNLTGLFHTDTRRVTMMLSVYGHIFISALSYPPR
uniref:Putative secreted protein n=1 Tax=Anopheles marajoara TaxID=58244 RepID=A0A2M4CCJ6_9DIPT